ncbi:MAG: hypothetical protein ACYTFI_01615 [Planctomycetota bacterium]|jgi:hypothetical protein
MNGKQRSRGSRVVRLLAVPAALVLAAVSTTGCWPHHGGSAFVGDVEDSARVVERQEGTSALGLRFSLGLSQGFEYEKGVERLIKGTARSVFVAVGADIDNDEYYPDGDEILGESIDVELTNREITLGTRFYCADHGEMRGEYIAAMVTAVDVDFEADGYGSSSGTGYGFVMALGYKQFIPESKLCGYFEFGLGLWKVPDDMDLTGPGGELVEYSEQGWAIELIRYHVNVGMQCTW